MIQLISEAVDQLRFTTPLEVLDAENKAVREHRQRRKEATSKEERELIGDWSQRGWRTARPYRRSWLAAGISYSNTNQNGMNSRKYAHGYRSGSSRPGKGIRTVPEARGHIQRENFCGVARLNLARWYNEVEAFGNNEFNKVLETFENHNTTIINYFERRLTNASAESFNAKIKAFRSQFRGVGDIKFFMFRLATLYS